jgi:ABC-type glycerol-3-phosphate transport system permease component
MIYTFRIITLFLATGTLIIEESEYKGKDFKMGEFLAVLFLIGWGIGVPLVVIPRVLTVVAASVGVASSMFGLILVALYLGWAFITCLLLCIRV